MNSYFVLYLLLIMYLFFLCKLYNIQDFIAKYVIRLVTETVTIELVNLFTLYNALEHHHFLCENRRRCCLILKFFGGIILIKYCLLTYENEMSSKTFFIITLAFISSFFREKALLIE